MRLVLALLVLLGACAGDGRRGRGGTVRAEWSAAGQPAARRPPARPGTAAGREAPPPNVGRFRAPGVVDWCPGARLAIVSAAQGDTGLGLTIHPRDSLVPGAYPLRAPATVRDTAPAATVALRLVSGAAIEGYQATGGTLTLRTVAGRRIAGGFDAELTTPAGTARLALRGELDGVPVRPGGAACPP